jgi:hypothetical protein
MSFDELQQQWKDEPSGDVQIPSEMDVLKKAITPIEKLRKRMRKDFWVQIITIFIGFGVIFFIITPEMAFEKIIMLCIFFSIILTFSFFYTFKFYTFYKTLNTMNLNSRKNLINIYIDFRINIELYKSQNFHLIYGNMILILFGGFMGTGQRRLNFINQITNGNYENLIIIIAIIVISPILASLTSEHLGGMQYYQNHFNNIQHLIDELEDV